MTVPYAPHPWDEIGPPPPLAESYEAADRKAEVAGAVTRIETLLRMAEEADERAIDMENDAQDERDDASSWRDEAEGMIEEEIEPIDPDTAERLTKRLGR